MSVHEMMVGHHTHEIIFDLFGGFTWSEPRAVTEAEDVGVNGDEGPAKGDVEHDIGGFTSDAWKRDESGVGLGDFAAMLINENLAKLDDVFGFVAVEADGLDEVADALFAEGKHFLRRVGEPEQFLRGAVHANVGGLCG